jgi:hypothetical protein
MCLPVAVSNAQTSGEESEPSGIVIDCDYPLNNYNLPVCLPNKRKPRRAQPTANPSPSKTSSPHNSNNPHANNARSNSPNPSRNPPKMYHPPHPARIAPAALLGLARRRSSPHPRFRPAIRHQIRRPLPRPAAQIPGQGGRGRVEEPERTAALGRTQRGGVRGRGGERAVAERDRVLQKFGKRGGSRSGLRD